MMTTVTLLISSVIKNRVAMNMQEASIHPGIPSRYNNRPKQLKTKAVPQSGWMAIKPTGNPMSKPITIIDFQVHNLTLYPLRYLAIARAVVIFTNSEG